MSNLALAEPAAPASTVDEQLDRRLRSGGGAPVARDVAARASSAYGTDLGGVRVHTDSHAAAMAEAHGFQAFAYGGDVFGTASALDTGTPHGQHVMMHELAHVAQTGGERAGGVHGKVEVGTATDASDALEVDADQGAAAAIAGRSYHVQRAPLAVRGFGATAKTPTDIVHENQTTQEAERAGFSKADGAMMYSGNWNRDMNQLLVPAVIAAKEQLQISCGPAIYSAMDLLHTMHFGYPIGGGPDAAPAAAKPGEQPAPRTPTPSPGLAGVEEFGAYDPVEHIDNPGGLTGHDGFRPGSHAGDLAYAGGEHEAYASVDPRYQAEVAKAQAKGSALANPDERLDAFKVDESGIPMYMQASRTQLIKHLEDGLRRAQGGKQPDYDRALRYAGESLHIMQDYYAHSNFTEIAVNLLIDAKFSGGAVAKDGQGASFVERFELAKHNPALADPKQATHHLNSYVHRKQGKQVDPQNMATKGGKEVMATGTFTLEDTLHSLKEKMGIALTGLNPFEKMLEGEDVKDAKAAGKADKLLTWLESNPVYFKYKPTEVGAQIGAKMAAVSGAVAKLGKGINVTLAGHTAVAPTLEKWAGNVEGAWKSTWGDAPGAAAAVEAGHTKAAQIPQDDAARQQAVTAWTQHWDQAAEQLQHGDLRAQFAFLKETGDATKLEKMALLIPVIGDNIAALIKEAKHAIKETLRRALETAWNQTMLQLTAEINAGLARALGSSEVSDKTIASSMTQPTHTDIAKDFSNDQNGTEDRFALTEELGEYFDRVGGAKQAGRRLIDKGKAHYEAMRSGQVGVIAGVKGAMHDLSSELNGPATEEGAHKHQHRHDGAWLAPVADRLAHKASGAILTAYKPQLDHARTGQPYDMGAISSTVMAYYQHPADCRSLWEGEVMAMLDGQVAGRSPEEGREIALHIKQELARRVAQPPMAQSDNEQHTTGGTNRHGDADHGDFGHGTDAEGHPAPHDAPVTGRR
ncbi:MAG: DUF4157 domain-containing protein [Myxococcales bacterium]|nr:DUF4157 domain-containing protein [Myxococcales bacterium]MBK7196408.1 DUF4157 domain-containing protein [Myxococcales bacterium]MBP6846675.1 DUF4157 domain-containing protein [Kofleriaceae bacterium]